MIKKFCLILLISSNSFSIEAEVSTRAIMAESIESVFDSKCDQVPKTSFQTQHEAECKILNKSEIEKSKKSSQDIEEKLFFE